MTQHEQPNAAAVTGSFLFAALLDFATVLTACSRDKADDASNTSDTTPKASVPPTLSPIAGKPR